MARKSRNQHVFINVPFDAEYEPLFVAIICGLSAIGLEPHSVVEIPESAGRFNRLTDLISSCDASIHDLSRVPVKRAELPRFNMPLELGLALGFRRWKRPSHLVWVFEREKHRYSLSVSPP